MGVLHYALFLADDTVTTDTEHSVRDFAGVSTLSIKPFIVRREMIERMFELGKDQGLKHPYHPVDGDACRCP